MATASQAKTGTDAGGTCQPLPAKTRAGIANAGRNQRHARRLVGVRKPYWRSFGRVRPSTVSPMSAQAVIATAPDA